MDSILPKLTAQNGSREAQEQVDKKQKEYHLIGRQRNEGLITDYLGGSSTCKYHVIPKTVGQFTGLHNTLH